MENSPKYGLHGKLSAKTGQGKALSKILLAAANLMQQAEGCQLYAVSIDTNNSDDVWITEIWDNQTNHDNSLKLPGVRELIGQAMPLLEGAPQKGQEFQILGGLGI